MTRLWLIAEGWRVVLRWLLLALAVAGVAVSAALHLRTPGSAAASYFKPPVTVLPARIEPGSTVLVSAEFSGHVAQVFVPSGAEVSEGQILAIVQNDEIWVEMERAEARYKFAERRLEAIRSVQSRGDRAALRELYTVAARAREGARERLEAFSQAEIEREYAEAKAKADQFRKLARQQLVTDTELTDAEARERTALQNVNTAREHWSRLKQEFDLAESQWRTARDRAERSGGPDAGAPELELEEAKLALRTATQRALGQQIVAPRAGTLVAALVERGDRIAGGTPLFRIADCSRLSFAVPITASMARLVKQGEPVVVRVPTDPPLRVPGAIESVLLVPDSAFQSYTARVPIDNPRPGTVLAGLEGAVEFAHRGAE